MRLYCRIIKEKDETLIFKTFFVDISFIHIYTFKFIYLLKNNNIRH